MDYRLLFTQRAIKDLAEIVGLIAQDDDEAAFRFDKALLDHVDLLDPFPRMASAIRERSRVSKLVHSPILGYYQIHEEKHVVEVLHFRHGIAQATEILTLT